MADVLKLSIARSADSNGLPLPSYTSPYHIGLNLQVAISSALRLESGDRAYVPTGFAFGIPDGYCGMVVSLPQLAKEHGLIVLDAPQIVHPADREPLFVLLQNMSSQAFVLHRGDIVAQLVIEPVVQAMWYDVTQNKNLVKATNEKTLLVDSTSLNDENDKMVSAKRVYKDPRHRFTEDEKNE